MTKIRPCPFCKSNTKQEVYQNLTASGSVCYGWRCLLCEHWVAKTGGGLWIEKEELLAVGVDLETLSFVFTSGQRCARCGHRGAENHHWMPVGIVGREEADKWPQDYLCKPCHDEWHRIVTPQLTTPI